jgi:spore germination protein YaaH
MTQIGRAGCILLSLLATFAIVLAPATAVSGHAASPARVIAYYVSYDPQAWASLEQHADELDLVDGQWVTITACGDLGSRDDETLRQFAAAHGVAVYPSLFTASGSLNHALLTDESVAAHTIDQIVGYVQDEDYPGFDLDLEGVQSADRDSYTAFVASLSSALHGLGKSLTLALAPKTSDVRTGWSGAYDYAALGGLADAIAIMAYEAHGAWGGPGSVAPYPWVDRVLNYVTSQIPPQTVRLGLAYYGYDWNVDAGTARALSYAQAARTATQYQVSPTLDPETRSVTYSYVAPASARPASVPLPARPEHQITRRDPPACGTTVPAPTPTPPPPAAAPSNELQQHTVWLEDSQAAAARLALVNRYGVGGIAAWRLGLDDPQVWPILDQWSGRS